jgi:hypothetical protein
MDITRRIAANMPAGALPGFGPANTFTHLRAFPPGDFQEVVRPGFGTPYSAVWLTSGTSPSSCGRQMPASRDARRPVDAATPDTGLRCHNPRVVAPYCVG